MAMRAVNFHPPDLEQMRQQLVARLQGSADFSPAAIALYTSDASNYRQVPLGIVVPKTIDDIKTTAQICQQYGASILMRGAGTSQNGQCVNHSIVVDCSQHLNRIIDINAEQKTATIEPGLVCDALKAAAQKHGLTFGPDPATHSRCTLGGMIGNNSCGPHSMMAGKTVENVVQLEILTSDGQCFWVGPTSDAELALIIEQGGRRGDLYAQLKNLVARHADDIRDKYPTIKRRVSGYNLDQLLPENGFNVARALVGSEGTCVSILRAKVKLVENPKYVRLVVLGFTDIFLAGDAVPGILPHAPIAMEGLDWNIVGGLNARQLRQKEVALLPEGRAWLLVELAGNTTTTVQSRVDALVAAMHSNPLVQSVLDVTSKADEQALWSIREQGASATSLALHPGDPDPIVGWEDTAVDPMQLGDYLRALYALVERYGYQTSLYGHFGDGCIHARMTFDTRSQSGIEQWRRFSQDIANLVVQYGGSLSGEHGDGQAKAEFLPIMFGDKLVGAFEEFKTIWDPSGQMNPRKLVKPYRMDENLRYGPDYATPKVDSTLHFVEDFGGFGRASERCIGMGKCRAATGAMCPSYQVTGEERYSTRGRAHLLHELMRGELVEDAWDNRAVADSLEHCLSCKSCKSSCPTKVDIAAYKAEFMHRHYAGHNRRPVKHYVFGQIGRWLPIASRLTTLSNWLSCGPVATGVHRMLGLDPQATLPKLAERNFNQWARTQADTIDAHFYWHGKAEHQPIVLWADSVNTHYAPDLLSTAVGVLTRCNYRVAIARAHFCCGRPLYEYGFLEKAKHQMNAIMEHFYPQLPKQAPVIVLEPSCLSVFKDELLRLHPDSVPAQDLADRTMTLAQLLKRDGVKPDKQLKKGIIHHHCHDKSLDTHTADDEWMQACFEELQEPETGCCGMAGSFGIAQKTRLIGQALFKRNLAPAIADSTSNTYIVANGFSCRSQVTNNTQKRVYHSVEIIAKCVS